MPNTLYAFLNSTLAGNFTRDLQGRVSFSYDPGYRWQSPEPTPLSPALPLAKLHHDGPAVAAFLDALVPESAYARQQAVQTHQAQSTAPFDLLLAIGFDTAGALVLHTDSSLAGLPSAHEPISEQQIAARLQQSAPLGVQPATAAEHWSVAGQQGKIALAKISDRWFTATGLAHTTHIIKPGIPGFAHQAFDEHYTMSIARNIGLRVANTEFCHFAAVPAIVVERFDRQVTNETITPLHHVDLTQALGVAATKKYEESAGPLAHVYADILRQTTTPEQAAANVWDFLDGIFINYLLGATDGHAKNYSVFLQGSALKLAPLYDLASIFPYLSQRVSKTLAMSIGGQRKLTHLRAKHLHRCAAKFQLDPGAVENRFRQLALKLPAAVEKTRSEPTIAQHLKENPAWDNAFHAAQQANYQDLLSWL